MGSLLSGPTRRIGALAAAATATSLVICLWSAAAVAQSQPVPAQVQPVPALPQPSPALPQPSPALPQPSPALPQPSPALPQPRPALAQPAPAQVQPKPAQPQVAAAPPAPATATPTCMMRALSDCHLADGHPDLTGLWAAASGLGVGSGADSIDFPGRGGSFSGFDTDGGLYRESTVDSGNPAKPNLPQYRPQYWDAITDLEYDGNAEDPEQECMPPGVPRLGPPAQIIQLHDLPMVILFYTGTYNRDTVRQVWTDGRPHNATVVQAETWNGDAVGHWEGDTLVIETIGFTDASWLHKNGYIHGFDMKVTERLTRTGNSLKWEATVDDPQYLLQPWTLTPVTMSLNTNPSATLIETLPCLERDRDHEVTHARNG